VGFSSLLAGEPGPGARRPGFRLFARAAGALTINRVLCGASQLGEICVDTTGNNIGGGFWPRGTANQYVFGSGIQVAGVVGGDNMWTGHTAAALFYETCCVPSTTGVRPIHNSTNPADVADWPDAARVPDELQESDQLFSPLLRGRTAASQQDIWWLSWDGHSTTSPHPLGVVMETRGMGWNYPRGNEDIVYFTFTVYNITSRDPADYVGVRPAMKDILLEKARDFREAIAGRFGGDTLPEHGYPILDLYFAFVADMDVGVDAGANYASVNVPFALGYAWEHRFSQQPGSVFDPTIFAPPFFAGTGLVGVKYLSSPGSAVGEPNLTTFGTYVNAGFSAIDFTDPTTATQLYRYLSAELNPAAGDGQCNMGNPQVTKICYVHSGDPTDVRFFQSTGPLTLEPGGFGSIVVAYIFAAPVAAGGCLAGCSVRPGDPRILGDPVRMAGGVNPIDSVAGYRGFEDANGDGRVEQREFEVVPGSLLDKALVAQAVFDSRFQLPIAPESPDFFLIPGDGQVTVLWRPSPAETTGDAFFDLAQSPTIVSPGGGAVANPLYDPNYRRFDVEGYRIYRGRVETPSSLRLIAQFDHTGTVMSDFGGQVNPIPSCAPELAIVSGCPVVFDPITPGVPRSAHVDYPLVGDLVQIKLGDRVRAANGTALPLALDTAFTGGASGLPPLRDTGVPLVYVDRGVRNDLRYFYSVVAFDLNSVTSGPTSLEGPRQVESATPSTPAANYQASLEIQSHLVGRGTTLDSAAPLPSLDPGTGRFAGPFPPANGFRFGLVQAVQTLLEGSGSFSLKLDSLRLGSAYEHGPDKAGTPAGYFFSVTAGAATGLALEIAQDRDAAAGEDSTFFPALRVGASSAKRYRAAGAYDLQGQVALTIPGGEYAGAWGRGCLGGAPGFAAAGTSGCDYNGPRWFDGPSPRTRETRAHPQAAHTGVAASPGPMNGLGNAGELTGVATVQMPQAYTTAEADYQMIEGVLGGALRAADFNLHWGAGGVIDSVVDITHNVPVPFDGARLAGGWGVLDQSGSAAPGSFDERPDVLTIMDFVCVEPLRSFAAVQSRYRCSTAEPYSLRGTVSLGPVAIWSGSTANARTAPVRPGEGFALYLAGTLTIFELTAGLPPAGAVWTLRTYVGAISGGQGAAGDRGPYVFTPQIRPFTAVGAELRLDYTASNVVRPTTRHDLSRVHTVPDPYYVMSKYERATTNKIIKFVNLPERAIIRIYSASGVLVTLLEHNSTDFGGSATWNVLNRNDQVVGSGVYFYHIESGDARRVGRFTVVNFAQ
jgi:hypothetical protein